LSETGARLEASGLPAFERDFRPSSCARRDGPSSKDGCAAVPELARGQLSLDLEPNHRKKKVMRPSQIHPRRSSETLHRLRRNTSSVPQTCSYVSRHGEFAHAIAMATAPMIRVPEPVSASRND
jgi:hypothetical protein